jgi:hypothetical protein
LEADRVDSVLMSLLDGRFDRVARIVARTLEQLRPEAALSCADLETVLARIETLVELGTIEANGDIRYMAYSVIRKNVET